MSGTGLSAVPRLRFAPAPTGFMHAGSARTALFNWLYARRLGGELVLRIEDTNIDDGSSAPASLPAAGDNRAGERLTRAQAEYYVDQIHNSLAWLGITFDGDVVRQSERTRAYQEATDRLLDEGHAYRRDGAVYMAVPREQVPTLEINDVVRGTVTWGTSEMTDFVIQRADGRPAFVFANAVDDIDGGITHVVRGEDLLNPTPRGLLVRRALAPDAPFPTYAHLPLLLGADGKKFSKRRGAVAVDEYRHQGMLAEAMVNYLALLGWGPKDGIEVRPLAEIATQFDLADVNPSGARFDEQKLWAMNATYVRQMSAAEFAKAADRFVAKTDWGAELDEATRLEQLTQLAPLVNERTTRLADVPDALAFLFQEPNVDPKAWQQAEAATRKAASPSAPDGPASNAAGAPSAESICAAAADAYEAAFNDATWLAPELHATLRAVGEQHGLKLRDAQMPVRVAVTGTTVGPPLFESMQHLGRERTLARLRAASQHVNVNKQLSPVKRSVSSLS